jgi:hypothetical protein
MQAGSQPNPPEVPWWRTVSLEELRRSASLVEQFVKKAATSTGNDSKETTEEFSRAVALQALFVHDDQIDRLLLLANAWLDDVESAIAPGAEGQEEALCGELLHAAQEVGACLQRCAELLSGAMSKRAVNEVTTLTERVRTLNTACVVFEVSRGTRRSFEAPARAAFKPSRRRRPDG